MRWAQSGDLEISPQTLCKWLIDADIRQTLVTSSATSSTAESTTASTSASKSASSTSGSSKATSSASGSTSEASSSTASATKASSSTSTATKAASSTASSTTSSSSSLGLLNAGGLGLGQESLQRQQLVSANVKLVTRLERSGLEALGGLDSEHDIVHWAKNLVDLADLGLVLKVNGGVEVGDLLIDGLADDIALASVQKGTHLKHLIGRAHLHGCAGSATSESASSSEAHFCVMFVVEVVMSSL